MNVKSPTGTGRICKLALSVAALASLISCAPESPSPNDSNQRGRGEVGTPGTVGVTGSGTGLGTGTNGPAETTSAPAPGSQPPAVSLSPEGPNYKPGNAGSNSRLKTSSENGGTLEGSGPVTATEGGIRPNSDAGTTQ